jgi:hypothetical protein
MNWPKSTEIGKFLAKERFYSHDAVSGALKQALVEDVEKITISHRLARDTLNVDAGTEFPEILVLNIKLRQSKVNEKLLDALDKSIRSGYVLFMLEYNEKEYASISHKTVNAKESCTIDKRWTTDWTDKVDLELRGTTLDAIYAGLIEQVSQGRVASGASGLADAVNRDIERAKLEKQIAELNQKLRNTDQLNKKFEIKDKIRTLEQKVKDLL